MRLKPKGCLRYVLFYFMLCKRNIVLLRLFSLSEVVSKTVEGETISDSMLCIP